MLTLLQAPIAGIDVMDPRRYPLPLESKSRETPIEDGEILPLILGSFHYDRADSHITGRISSINKKLSRANNPEENRHVRVLVPSHFKSQQ